MLFRKPVIGLNADFHVHLQHKTETDQGQRWCYSHIQSGYYDSIMKAGGVPVIIPPCLSESDLDQLLETLDGMVMVGGADLNPVFDGYIKHSFVRPLHERRERFDRMLIQQVAKHRVPFFGIGTGMQLLNVSQGGTLYLHIPEDLPRALPHRDPNSLELRHTLLVTPDSLMRRVYGEHEIIVNSSHHMAVDDVAAGFLATARSPDGVIEAIESIQEDWFAFGTQFHPESPSNTAVDIRVFFEFIEEIMRRKGMEIPEFTEEMLFSRSRVGV
ncbi:MAG: gamma-glutamyl-gamma-aminobutyrate hydrolase family protein [Planctomycetaceae bacterium]|nr:gamma-glutamyl-gamma-aminobutyrate hydrolase family protein [Planctomycetaceae bacterium]